MLRLYFFKLTFARLLKSSGGQNLICVISGLIFFAASVCSCTASSDGSNYTKPLASNINEGVVMRVLWTVAAYHVVQNSIWGEAEAREMLFKPLDINSSAIIFDGQSCHDVIFSTKVVDAAQYLAERFQTTPHTLSLEGETMKVITTNCSLPGFDEYMRLPDRRLVVFIQGVLFVFKPAVNY